MTWNELRMELNRLSYSDLRLKREVIVKYFDTDDFVKIEALVNIKGTDLFLKFKKVGE
jgi:hypothetical protein